MAEGGAEERIEKCLEDEGKDVHQVSEDQDAKNLKENHTQEFKVKGMTIETKGNEMMDDGSALGKIDEMDVCIEVLQEKGGAPQRIKYESRDEDELDRNSQSNVASVKKVAGNPNTNLRRTKRIYFVKKGKPVLKNLNCIESMYLTARMRRTAKHSPKFPAPKNGLSQGSAQTECATAQEETENEKAKKSGPEMDPIVLARRQKQIDYGKNTLGYTNYLEKVPKEKRELSHPRTPPKEGRFSRRAWDGLIKRWRIQLHHWDPPGEKNTKEGESNGSPLQPESLCQSKNQESEITNNSENSPSQNINGYLESIPKNINNNEMESDNNGNNTDEPTKNTQTETDTQGEANKPNDLHTILVLTIQENIEGTESQTTVLLVEEMDKVSLDYTEESAKGVNEEMHFTDVKFEEQNSENINQSGTTELAKTSEDENLNMNHQQDKHSAGDR